MKTVIRLCDSSNIPCLEDTLSMFVHAADLDRQHGGDGTVQFPAECAFHIEEMKRRGWLIRQGAWYRPTRKARKLARPLRFVHPVVGHA